MYKFGDIFEFRKKSKVKAGEGETKGKFPFYTSSNVLNKYIDKYLFDGESLIFGTGGNASIHFARDKFNVSTDCLVAQTKNGKINTKFIYYFLLLNKHILEQGFKGAGLKHISKSYISNISIPEVDRKEQDKIVQVLDRVNDLRQKRKEQLTLLDDYLKSVFLEMFGDPLSNPKMFPIKELVEFFYDKKTGTKCGPFGTALKKHEYKKAGIPVWSMDNISQNGEMFPKVNLFIDEEKYHGLKNYSTYNGDIIISRAGTVGKMCVLKTSFNKSIISTNLIRVRFNNQLLPEYFVSLMTYCKGRVGRLKTGSDGAFTHMNTGILNSLKFPYPPVELQKKFIKIQNKIRLIKKNMKKSLSEMDDYFNALMQRYFG
jgi:type I restriction enzyme S subunit